MKKTLVALAALAVVGAASAQSSVTIYGVLDANYNYLSADGAGSLSRLVGSGSNSSSRLGFKGTEDLGGGMKASFVLEAGINVDTGAGANTTANNNTFGQSATVGSTTANFAGSNSSSAQGQQGLTFNRQAFVALGGGFGEVRLGRDYAPTFWNLTVYDPFSTVGVGSTLNVTLGTLNPNGASIAPPGTPKPEIRTSNAISYFLPTNIVPGLTGQVTYAFSEAISSCNGIGNTNGTGQACIGADDDGRYVGFRVGYAAGPLSVALASGRTTYSSSSVSAVPAVPFGAAVQQRGDYNATNLGLAYDLGVAKLMAQYGIQTIAGNNNQAVYGDQKLTHWLLGASVPMGAGEIKASYNHGSLDSRAVLADNSQTQAQLALGYVHNLSKRTALYATYSRLLAQGVGAVASQALNSQAAAADQTVGATGYDIGIRHSF